jgi:hypothetical protein
MRTISDHLETLVGAATTGPGYLVEIGFSTVLRLSTRGDINVLGNDWIGWKLSISGLSMDASNPLQQGTMTLSNAELVISTLVLEEGIADRSIRIYKFYGEEPEEDDPVVVFDGVGGRADIDTASAEVKVTLRQQRDQVQFAPSIYITVEQGFSMLPPAGTIIQFNGQSYILEPEA